MAMTKEQAVAARKLGSIRRNAALNEGKAWTLADRAAGLDERLPQSIRKNNAVTKALYSLLVKDHLAYGIDEEGRKFADIDAEIAFIQRHPGDVKLKVKHYARLVETGELDAMPEKTEAGRVSLKKMSPSELAAIKQYLSDDEYKALAEQADDNTEESEAA